MELTTENLVKEVRKLAEEQPDFVYPKTKLALEDVSNTITCFYSSNKHHCACIFGQAFTRMGIEPKKEWEGKSIWTLLAPEYDFPISDTTPTQRNWCNDVQRHQDGGKRWRECIEAADSNYPI